MYKIKIFTDSTCDLSEELMQENDISVVPLYINFGDQSYRDGVDITTKELYEKVDVLGTLPKTAAPSPLDYINAFKPYIQDGYEIVYIGLSSKQSSTIQNAVLAAQELAPDKIHVIDSLNLSTGLGILVMKAVDLLREGLSCAELVTQLGTMVDKVRTAFTIDTFEYLYKGGRCSAMQSLVGSVLGIRPIIKLVDGKNTLHEKLRGRKKALAILLEEIGNDIDKLDHGRVFITHSYGAEDAVYLQNELSKRNIPAKVVTTNAGCVISSHCGKNTIGIIYMVK